MRDESRPAFSNFTPNGSTPNGTHSSGVPGASGGNGAGEGQDANGQGHHAAPNGVASLTAKIQANLAVKCPNCKELLVGKDWEKNLRVCQKCGHHFRLSANER